MSSVRLHVEVPGSAASAASLDRAAIDRACAAACAAIAPAWPLDRAIAVNPHWRRIHRPLSEVAARMALFAGIRVLPERARLRVAWESGRVTPADLQAAVAEAATGAGPAPSDAAACIAALAEAPALPRLPLLIDLLDAGPDRHARLSWRQAITHQISQACASYFDRRQADWQPDRGMGLYAFWRDTLAHDPGIARLMGAPGLRRALATLPSCPAEVERRALERLGLPEAVCADYLEAVLLTVNGWASWCAWLDWEAGLAGRRDPHLRELLAIRLAWGLLLLACREPATVDRAVARLRGDWQALPATLEAAQRALQVDLAWQRALEIGYQRGLALRLRTAVSDPAEACEVQAVFCIDVRSERLRRALEATWPAISTHGFAGFFGLPIAHTPLAAGGRRALLPGLLPARLEVEDQWVAADATAAPPVSGRRRQRFALDGLLARGSRWPGSAYSYVEAVGAGYLGALLGWFRPGTAARRRDHLAGLPAAVAAQCRPQLRGLDTAARAELAAGVLRAMGLATRFAPLVLLVGHGSQSRNNAHAAILECGACGGHDGELNARVLAGLLNDPAVRAALPAHGIVIPAATWFVAALHNTTTDEIEGFDLDLLPAAAAARWAALQPVFAQAGDQVRRERAGALGLDPRTPAGALLDALRRRGNDGAQTRPEWGLAGNAALIIAPRARSRGVQLDGRVFLHDYAAGDDPQGRLLEQLMTAPLVVAHWINAQYHASTCDPLHLGSGNKLLHNVVGAGIGVFEGNGGDLRIGLPRQSLHDGSRDLHEPLRLTALVDAPTALIDGVLARQPLLRQLLDNGWLHLWRFDERGLQVRTAAGWRTPDWLAVAT